MEKQTNLKRPRLSKGDTDDADRDLVSTADRGPLVLVDEYVDHARRCEVYRVRVPTDIVEAFRAVIPSLPLPSGRRQGQRRGAIFYSDAARGCRYAGHDLVPTSMASDIGHAVGALGAYLGVPLNGAIVDCCDDGDDAVAPHAYDDADGLVSQDSVAVSVLGDAAVQRALPRYPGCAYVVTLGLGATRTFHLVDKATAHVTLDHRIGDGDVVVMAGHTQDHYLHAVPIEPFVREPHYRIVLCHHHHADLL